MQTFKDAVRKKDFTVSAGLFLVPETTADMIRVQADLLKGSVDGVLVTDNQSGQLHMSALAASGLLLQFGIDPIMQLACRNRNRIALLADLLGAAALGVTSLQLLRGNRVPEGFDPRPKAVMDVDATELISIATNLNSDENFRMPPDFYVGGIVTPHKPKSGWVPDKLRRKVDAGAHFMMTHLCMDIPVISAYMKHLVADGLLRRISVFASLAVPGSADDARWLREHRPNVLIPDDIVTRLEQAADAEQEGVRICAEQLQQLADIPGIGGAHIVATRNLASIPAAVAAAGLRRPEASSA